MDLRGVNEEVEGDSSGVSLRKGDLRTGFKVFLEGLKQESRRIWGD